MSDGGVLVAITEMALAGNIGADVWLKAAAAEMFAEDQGLYLVSCQNSEHIPDKADEFGVATEWIASTGGDSIVLKPLGETVVGRIPLADLRAAHEGFFPRLMGAEGVLA